ncbi:MAG: hypothetical protein HYT47_01530 [Candidatus Vogelbacteria bacterium]|nr:hypothetical protein [Candidatus Vogelbacteria bacterium]
MLGHHDLLLRRPRRLVTRRLIFLCLFLMLATATWLFIFLNDERFSLRVIEVSGNRLLTDESLIAAARQALTGRRWFVFRRDRYWFYDPRTVTSVLSQRFDRLSAVTVAASSWQILRLEVAERATAALWCPVELRVSADCFYLDATGLAFARAPHFSRPPLLVITGFWPLPRGEAGTSTMSAAAAVIGSQPLPRSLFSRLIKLRSRLDSSFDDTALAGATMQQIIVTSFGDIEFNLASKRSLARPFKIMVGGDQSDEEILTFLRATLAAPAFQSELAAGRALEYFDLRFAHKVFYRFRE